MGALQSTSSIVTTAIWTREDTPCAMSARVRNRMFEYRAGRATLSLVAYRGRGVVPTQGGGCVSVTARAPPGGGRLNRMRVVFRGWGRHLDPPLITYSHAMSGTCAD
eukprot:2355825-Prymnesium_polylepis.3